MKKYIAIIGLALSLTSCLDREPISYKSEEGYFHSAADFKLAVNDLYQYLPKNNTIYGGMYNEDTKSDNQCSSTYYAIFLKGYYKTQAQSNSNLVWNFDRLRAINYALNKMLDAEGEPADQTMARHYIGETYFFRAYEYYRLLRNYGDLPIVRAVQNNNSDELTANAKRYPRNVVARFIIRDLERAIDLLQEDAPESGRISKDAARALLSRVALFEGTWEKYNAGTCFVPGNEKWPGHVQWPEPFGKIALPTVNQLPAKEAAYNDVQCSGSAEGEVQYFLTQAMNYADTVASKRSLDADYAGMFNKFDGEFSNTDEVILARYYQKGVLAHSCSAYLKNGGGCGATRALVNSFLMKNGLPIYASGSGYKGDDIDTYQEFQDRDERLTLSVRAAGSYITTTLEGGKYVNDTLFYNQPYIYNTGNEKSTTGYDICKWLVGNYSINGYKSSERGLTSAQLEQRTQYNCTTYVPLIRAAECYLNYLEAYYMLNGNLGGNCDKYWKALRTRAGVSTNYLITIANTDLSKENDLAVWSKGQEIDKTLYNIRRERRCEFIAEGMRFDDLKRWRALDKMVDYQPEGFHLWGTKNEALYSGNRSKWLSSDVVTQSGISVYLHPLQVSASSAAYNGYTFPKPHYLEPIPLGEFLLVISPDGVTHTSAGMSILYQNPGWPSPDEGEGTADYTYDCD